MQTDLTDITWDAVVIGTGIGGGTAGRALAEAGWKVLFLERGPAGYRAEETRWSDRPADAVARALRGFWPDPVTVRMDGAQQAFYAPLGAGVGGSSVFYAATLERPARHDLDHITDRPHPTGGWPVSYDAFFPALLRAEALYGVAGGADPLDPAPPPPPGAALEAGEARLAATLTARGLHPYALHAALRRLPGCSECLGRKCPRPCKMDGRSAGVEPALATGHAALSDRTEALRILSDGAQAHGVVARRDGAEVIIRARHVVVAAGALSTPRLLAASGGTPAASPALGRYLMVHLNEVFALWGGGGGSGKGLGFRDLYFAQGQRLGMVQAMGISVGQGEILHHLRQRLARHVLGRGRLLQEGARVPAGLAARALGAGRLFVGLLEDLPLAENRVLPDPTRITIDYRVTAELAARRALFRRLIRRACGAHRVLFTSAAPEPNWGHPCGTARMGTDPALSVTNAVGRVHGMANLWVADAAVFPTSMGVNPSLTIAAHALRLADAMEADR